MAFFARDFIFNNSPSELWGLHLGQFNGAGEETTTTSSDISLLTQKLFRRPIPLYYSAEQTPVLSFPLSMYAENDLTAEDFSEISSWLFGQQNYSELRICQNDMLETYFNCFLTQPQIIRVGNIIRGISCVVLCDSPFGYKQPVSYSDTFPDGYSAYETIEIFNPSEDSFYTFPTSLILTGNVFGGTITLKNITDNIKIIGSNRESTFTVSPNEVLTMNCDIQTLTSSINTYALSQFTSKNWFRLVKGYNQILVTGQISALSMTFPIATKIGG